MSEESDIVVELNSGRETSPKRHRSSVLSLDRIDRVETIWTEKNEALLKDWMIQSEKAAVKHVSKAKHFKAIYMSLGLLGSVLPIVLSGITDILQDHQVILTTMLIISGVLNGVVSFINPSKKSELHFIAESKFAELSTKIKRDLSMKKSERIACDMYLENIMNLLNRFNSESPPL